MRYKVIPIYIECRAGFSLIEVVLTLVIFSLLMGLVTSNMRGNSLRNGLKAERGQMALLVEDLRTLSLQANRELSLRNYLAIARNDTSMVNSQSAYVAIDAASERRRIALASQVTLNVDVRIRPPGACSSGSGTYILSNSRSVNFTVEALNCRVRFG